MSPLWLLLGAAALAGEPTTQPAPPQADAAVPGEVDLLLPGWREVYEHLRELRTRVGGPVVLAYAGKEARGTAHRVEALFATGEVVLRPVPLAGDPQAELSLAQSATGLSCVAWLAREGSGVRLRALGDCGAVEPTGEDAPPPPLLRVVPRSGQPTYKLVDEQGRQVDPWRYATLTRDPELRADLISERRRRRLAARGLEIAGAVVLASAAAPLYSSLGASEEVGEDRRFAAVFLAASGVTLFLGGRLDRRGLEARQAQVGNYVHETDARHAVDDWNRRALEARRPAPPAVIEVAPAAQPDAEPAPLPEPEPAAQPDEEPTPLPEPEPDAQPDDGASP